MSFDPHHILVPVALDPEDDVSLAADAVLAACDIAEKFNSKISLVHFAQILPAGGGVSFDVTGHVLESFMKVLKARFEFGRLKLNELQEAARARGISIEGRVIESIDSTAHVIVATAGELKADLLVMSSHGRRGLSKMLFGSVTATVAEKASIPVLVLHQTKIAGAEKK